MNMTRLTRWSPVVLTMALLLAYGCTGVAPAPDHPHEIMSVVVTVPASADATARLAAEELAWHLALSTGHEVRMQAGTSVAEGAYGICMGPPGTAARLELSAGAGAYFLGADQGWVAGVPAKESGSAHGVLRATYELLRSECGLGWPSPTSNAGRLSDAPILRARHRKPRIVASPGRERPQVVYAPWRSGAGKSDEGPIAEFHSSPAAEAARRNSFAVWLRRQGVSVVSFDLPTFDTEFTTAPDWSLCRDVGLPFGREAVVYNALRKGGVASAVPHVLRQPLGGWRIGGLPAFVLAQATRGRRLRPFPSLETLFCAEYGAAASDVRAYFAVWRGHYEACQKHLLAELEAPTRAEWLRSVYTELEELYDLGDFRLAEAFLQNGLLRPLDAAERRRLQRLILAHNHAKMIYLAVTELEAVGDQPEAMEKALGYCRRLADFRGHFKDRLDIPFAALMAQEREAGDVAGTEWEQLFHDTAPVVRLPGTWRMRFDPNDEGRDKGWFNTELSDLAEWADTSIGRPPAADAELPGKEAREHACRVVWLATEFAWDDAFGDAEELLMNFRGVLDDCTAFVNGTLLGTHSFRNNPATGVSFRLVVPAQCLKKDEKQWFVMRIEAEEGRVPWLDFLPWLSLRQGRAAPVDETGPPEPASPSEVPADSGGAGAPAMM